ncbi:MAG TPA: hypothetical protein VH501_05175 [Solirubrobacterales bacterium]|jgi:hypothetical protein
MPPNSTQNLNAKLSRPQVGQRRNGAAPSFARPLIRGSAPRVKIVGGPRSYRGGYHLSV